jgi:hypothetical protein
MKIHETAVRRPFPKLCHARVGQCIRIHDDVYPHGTGLYLVCSNDARGVPSYMLPMRGLYDAAEGSLFLVCLQTGLARCMPHLSSRVEIVQDAQVYVGKALSQELRREEQPAMTEAFRKVIEGTPAVKPKAEQPPVTFAEAFDRIFRDIFQLPQERATEQERVTARIRALNLTEPDQAKAFRAWIEGLPQGGRTEEPVDYSYEACLARINGALPSGWAAKPYLQGRAS